MKATIKTPKDGFVTVGNMKVFNFKNIETEGIREVVPVDEKKLLNLSFKCVKDPRTNIWYGIQESLDQKTGRVIFKRITIPGRRTYDLQYTADAEEYAVVKRHVSMLSSPYQRGKPIIRVYDRVAIATAKLKEIDLGMDAVHIARKELSGEELIDFARVLGITPENNEPLVVKQLLAEKAQRNPKEFMRAYHDGNREIIVAFKRAIAVGLIKYTLDGGYIYKEGYPLGSSEITAIATLRSKTELLNSIDVESKNMYKENLMPNEEIEDKSMETKAHAVAETPESDGIEEDGSPESKKQPELGNAKMAEESDLKQSEPIDDNVSMSNEQLQQKSLSNPERIPGGPSEIDITSDGDGLTEQDRKMIQSSGGAIDSDPGFVE